MLSDLLISMPPGFMMMLAALPIMALPHHARQAAMLVAIGLLHSVSRRVQVIIGSSA